jgi:hypothetical protein
VDAPAAGRIGPELAAAERPVRMVDGEDEAGADGVMGTAVGVEGVLGGVAFAGVTTRVTGLASTFTFGSFSFGSFSFGSFSLGSTGSLAFFACRPGCSGWIGTAGRRESGWVFFAYAAWSTSSPGIDRSPAMARAMKVRAGRGATPS